MKVTPLIALFLLGCAGPGDEFAQARDSWEGATYDEVVLRWGTPARSAKLTDGSNAYTWISQSVGTRERVTPSIGVGVGSGGALGIGTGVMFGSPDGGSVRCERTLIFREGRVAEQAWQGPLKYCDAFRR